MLNIKFADMTLDHPCPGVFAIEDMDVWVARDTPQPRGFTSKTGLLLRHERTGAHSDDRGQSNQSMAGS